MQSQPSLIIRLSAYLLAGQLFCFAVTMIGLHLTPLLGRDPAALTAWNYLAEMRARHLVIASLTRAPDGRPLIEPNAELRALVAQYPTLRFAAFEESTNTPLMGSAPDLAAALSGHKGIETNEMKNFRIKELLNGELSGSYQREQTPFGHLIIATHGYVFSWKDFFYHIFYDILTTFRESAFIIIMAIAIGWVTLRRGLAPLDNAVRKAGQIDIASLDQRIPLGNIPREIAPLVMTVNDALARLDAGVERQKRFLANAAHELRTPLTIMSARIANPEKPTFKRDLNRDVRRLRNIVEQLLSYARFGREDPSPARQFDLNELVQSTVDDYALIAVKNMRTIEFQSEQARIDVKGDWRAAESVLGNLIDNAIRAEPEGGNVVVRIGEDATVEIEDHGEGISPDDRDRIFEPFWRKNDESPGAGLGLAIAREIVDNLGGSVCVDETPGGGATFKLRFSII